MQPEGLPRDWAAAALRAWGVHLVVAGDGYVALSYLDAMPRPSLLVLIEPLARLDAAELLRRLEARADAADFQALLVSDQPLEGFAVGRGSLRGTLPPELDLAELKAQVLAWKAEVTRPRVPAP